MVPIRPHGPRPPLFCVHPAGGAVLCYVDLARWLGPDQPLYGLQGPDPRGDREPFGSVEEMAACYVEAIRAVQPRGPFFLAGFSFGGLVAYEMSQQLHRAGLAVALLALLDTGSPRAGGLCDDASFIHGISTVLERHDLSDSAADPEDERRLWGDFVQLARRYSAQARREPDKERRTSELGAVQQLFRTLRLLPMDEGLGYPEVRRYMRFLRANLRAGRRYEAVAGPHRITLFRTQQGLAGGGAGSVSIDAWAALAGGGLDLHEVPGHHLELCVPPAVEVVTQQLRACMDLASQSMEKRA
jgi:thioesterase domain-containing protein